MVGGVLFVVLAVLVVTLRVPYVILSPGPTLNTLGSDDQGQSIITISGRPANPTTGHLNLTTVDVSTAPVTVFGALAGWLEHDEVVVPRDSIYPPGQSTQQVNQQDTQDFIGSQDNAQAAAFCELGYPKGIEVGQVAATSKARGVLQPGDQFISFNGSPTTTSDQLLAELQAAVPGSDATVLVKRDGVSRSLSVPLSKPITGTKGASIGIDIVAGCVAPFQVQLGLANEIGGPSAGLMFALGIMDKVGTVDLTKGRFIAGTGTIDGTGAVGPIGGIQLKMIAARKAGATVFLAPAGNCSDVVNAIPKGLEVVKVDTLHDAVADLLAVQQDKAVPHC